MVGLDHCTLAKIASVQLDMGKYLKFQN